MEVCVSHKFLIHRRGDHVGVAVVDIDAGERVEGVFMDDDSTIEVDAHENVPLGHKIAIAVLPADAPVLEYGTQIGVAPQGFEPGDYVHTHNLRSSRW
jgi:(2R)-sulfolactate sulfo-lyase subunit alpha